MGGFYLHRLSRIFDKSGLCRPGKDGGQGKLGRGESLCHNPLNSIFQTQKRENPCYRQPSLCWWGNFCSLVQLLPNWRSGSTQDSLVSCSPFLQPLQTCPPSVDMRASLRVSLQGSLLPSPSVIKEHLPVWMLLFAFKLQEK